MTARKPQKYHVDEMRDYRAGRNIFQNENYIDNIRALLQNKKTQNKSIVIIGVEKFITPMWSFQRFPAEAPPPPLPSPLQRHSDYFHQPLIKELMYAASSDCECFCAGKRALLLQSLEINFAGD